MQIYTVVHPQYPPDALFDPDYNLQAAYDLSGGGQNWNPWCTWETSACGGTGRNTYRAYLAEADVYVAAAEGGVAIQPPPGPEEGAVSTLVIIMGGALIVAGGLGLSRLAR